MAGPLYIVPTPIGNLDDLSPRAAAVLGAVDFVAAEDTRVTLKLLNHLALKKPLMSYYEHSGPGRTQEVLNRMAAGQSCALCSDAGTPLISDPGSALVRGAQEMGIPIVPLPGPCAAVVALSACGMDVSRFVFEGFLPQNKRQRKERLAALAGEFRSIVFYEAPHKLCQTLADFETAFGADRPLFIGRELTKLHEELWPATVGTARRRYKEQTPRGEFVLVMAGVPQPKAQRVPLEDAAALAQALAEAENLPPAEAARQAATQTGWPRSEIYRRMRHGEKA